MVFNIFLPFLIALLFLLLLSRLVSRFLLELLGEKWYMILLWPGVVVHELSHLLGAVLTLTRVTGFSLWPKAASSNGRVLGSVTHEATGNPVSLILISLFPVLGSSFILWLLTLLLLPSAPATAPIPLISSSVSSWNYLVHWWQFVQNLFQSLNLVSWQSWIFIYLVIAISAHLAPSTKDLSYTAAGFTALSLLGVLLIWGGEIIGHSLGEKLASWFSNALSFFTPLLSYSLAILLLVALLAGVAFGIKRLNERVVWW